MTNQPRETPGMVGTLRRATPDAVSEAAALIIKGRLVVMPTETVYGLGADALNDQAVAAIFEAKGRPRFNPLIVHFADARRAGEEVEMSAEARALAAAFWPGALSLVLARRRQSGISLLCSAGLDSLAVRVPGHRVALDLLAAVERPIAAPSANASGTLSPTTAQHVVESLGAKVSLVLDDGPTALGVESTVLDLTGRRARLLRPGAVTREALEDVIGRLALGADILAPRSPGQLSSHYAPRLPLRLNAEAAGPREALLAFGPRPPSGAGAMLNLSPAADLRQAAANFFTMLRRLDRPELEAIAVMRIPEHGLGDAINDRLRRAAAARGDDG